jgi:large subunit ribosomal protein L4
VVTVHALAVDQLNTYDVLVNDEVVFTEAALAEYVARSTGMASLPSTSSGNMRAEPVEAPEEPTNAELASASVEDSAEPTDAELAATAASVAEVLEPTDATTEPAEAAHGMAANTSETEEEEDAK